MRIILASELFESSSSDEAVALLDVLTTAVRDRRHHAILTKPTYAVDADNGPIDRWLANRSLAEASMFRGLISDGLLRHVTQPIAGSLSDAARPRRWHFDQSLTIKVERRSESDWQKRVLTLQDAADLLREPCHLVLDNERTDRAFVRLLAGPTDGDTFQKRCEEPGRVVVHGGGGGESKKWLESLIVHHPLPIEARRRMLRTWVLFDKDAGAMDARSLSKEATNLIDLCERVVAAHGTGLSWICLFRRECESYVPDCALHTEKLERHTEFVERVIAWRADPERVLWAGALDLKNGLRGDLRADLAPEKRKNLKENKIPLEACMLKEPFTALVDEEIRVLERGLVERLGEALRAATPPPWSSELPTEYDRGPSDQAPRHELVRSLFDRI